MCHQAYDNANREPKYSNKQNKRKRQINRRGRNLEKMFISLDITKSNQIFTKLWYKIIFFQFLI